MAAREEAIKKASWIGIIGNALLSALKISAGLIAGSLSVVADGIDSFSDILTSVITLVTARILTKPPDKKYPYGYEKADTIATKTLSFIIFFAGAQLFITAIKRLISGEIPDMPGKIALYVTALSICGKIFLSFYQQKTGKETKSSMLIANAKNMQNDVIISGSVLLGLVFIYLFKIPWLDAVTALLVSIWVLIVAFRIYIKTSVELMDGTTDCTIYDRIFQAIEKVEGVYHPHRLRVRNIGHKIMINIDLEMDGSLSLKKAHELAHKVESSIKNNIDNVFDVAIHVEPMGFHLEEKNLGITKTNI